MIAPRLEPQALELRPDDDGRIRLSTAISLKRIADALEKPETSTAYTLDGGEVAKQLEKHGEQIAVWLNQQIRSGKLRG